jgi:glycosyltransferase involved in cell wall biosynthesis
MKILFIITGLGVGGAERQVLSLAECFAAKGHNVKIAYLVEPAVLRAKVSSIEIIPLGLRKNPFSLINTLCNLFSLIKVFSPNIVHSHMFHANLLARCMRVFIRVPRLICTAHSTNEGGRLRMAAYRLTDSLADVSTNVSLQAVKEFERRKAVPVGTMISVLNGIDIDKYMFDENERLAQRKQFNVVNNTVILAVGRLYEAKGYPNLLNAFSMLAADDDGLRLWIIGDGPLREQLEHMVDALALNEKVSFLGVRHDVEKIMSAADVFVLSSKWEGFGLVVAEAMAVERVVVATDCGGVAEVLGSCGFLVQPDDPKGLSDKLKEAIELSPEQSKALGKEARDRIVKEFSLDSVVNRWIDIYRAK